jgi:peroxiredoxin Q/BCP
MMPAIEVGRPAPEFEAVAANGETIRLADYVGRRSVVLFFYPMDGTPTCTREACSFRDAYEDFLDAGAAVIGVSGDSDARHQDFAKRNRLPFVLVSDRDRKLRRAFGVSDTLGLIPKRVTFVIDPEGIVRMAFSAVWVADEHVQRALEVVRSFAKAS